MDKQNNQNQIENQNNYTQKEVLEAISQLEEKELAPIGVYAMDLIVAVLTNNQSLEQGMKLIDDQIERYLNIKHTFNKLFLLMTENRQRKEQEEQNKLKTKSKFTMDFFLRGGSAGNNHETRRLY